MTEPPDRAKGRGLAGAAPPLEEGSGRLGLIPARHRENEIRKQTLASCLSAASARQPQPQFPFRRDGFLHELLEQTGPVCLVRRSKGSRQMDYEVARLQRHKSRKWPNGKFTPEGWHYPTSQQWGTYGWSYADLAKARKKYDEVRSKMACERVRQGQKGGQKPPGRIRQRGATQTRQNRAEECRSHGKGLDQPKRALPAQ
jgi:hypothetical protein